MSNLVRFTLNFAVIHKFDKEQYSGIVDDQSVVYKPLFDVTDAPTITLVETINSLLGKKDNNVAWGTFKPKNSQGSFPATVNALAYKPDNLSFTTMSRTAILRLVEEAQRAPFSTGGYYLFAGYENSGGNFILIANIKEHEGLRLNKDNFKPEEVTGVDLSKVLQAARINITRYKTVCETNSEVDQELAVDSEALEKTYLCFISKGRDSKASEYFVEALGCQHGVPARIATTKAIDAVPKFFDKHSDLKPFKRKAKENVILYLRERLESKENAKVSDIYEAAKKAIPTSNDAANTIIEEFIDFLNNEENQVPDEFSVHSQALKAKTRIKATAQNKWDLSFERMHLGTDSSSAIYYNPENQTITLSGLQEITIKRIKKALKQDEN